MYLAHGPLSFVLNESIQKKDISKLTQGEHIAVSLLSIFFGILPDFDFFLLSILNEPTFNHHQVFTHSILFWLILWIFLRIGIYIFKKISDRKSDEVLNERLVRVIQKSFLIGTLSHLLADTLFSYSLLFLPIQKEITILGGIFDRSYFNNGIFSVSMSVEILIIFIFVLYLYRAFIKKNRYTEYVIYSLIGISICFILLSTYMALNIYTRSTVIKNGIVQNDLDYDSIIDSQDSDIGNSGTNNILNVDKYTLAQDTERILNTHSLTGNQDNILGDISYRYGGYTSYRLISQSFWEQGLSIEPVLSSFARNMYHIQGYTFDNSYDDLLYEYLKSNFMLRNFNVNVGEGNIFFILDKKDDVVNEGIVLGNNRVGIILKNDKRTTIHTLEDVYREYDGYTFRVQRDF